MPFKRYRYFLNFCIFKCVSNSKMQDRISIRRNCHKCNSTRLSGRLVTQVLEQTIGKIRAAEEQGDQLIADAKAQAEQILDQAKVNGKAAADKAIADARNLAQAAADKAEAEAAEVRSKAEAAVAKEVENLKQNAAAREGELVKAVLAQLI